LNLNFTDFVGGPNQVKTYHIDNSVGNFRKIRKVSFSTSSSVKAGTGGLGFKDGLTISRRC
jgi:hypothetical protein